ncbi:hypothetical protein HN51_026361 [Arachis hypogaea]|uniref:TPD1 protein homolog 1 n=1 Tax=Arachis hypogaea TaxID=3818 RepID=UPI000A2C3861|nr:uncharacterized protein LOC112704143 [Arachis hypogaea]QHO28948.1 uncharacterized protein DS421_7g221080 [Arachis hypogaea]
MSTCFWRAISLVLLMLVNGFVSGINGAVVDCAAVECKVSYIKITQGKNDGSNDINGVIVNTCPSLITDLRVDCGSFIQSLKGIPVPPNILKVVSGNECVVNNGNPIGSGDINFKYSNTEILPLTVTSFKCLSP